MFNLKPEHFDILGIFVFIYITFIALWALLAKNPLPDRIFYVLLVIGILGLIVDLTMVYRYIIRRKSEKD